MTRTEAKVEPAPVAEQGGDEGRLRPKYARLGAFGLLLAGIGAGIVFVVILATEGVSEDLGFFGVASAVALLAAGLSWRFGTWSKIVGIVASLLIGLALFWTVFMLAAVNSPIEFTVGLLVPTGVLLGISAHIAALVAKRRGNVTATATPVERKTMQGISAAIVLGALVSVVLFLNARQTVDPVLASGAEVVRMSNFEFHPTMLEVGTDGPTKILVHNDDVITHTFTVPELDIDHSLVPGSEVLVEIEPPAGSFVVYCKPHSDTSDADPDPDDNMVMRLIAR